MCFESVCCLYSQDGTACLDLVRRCIRTLPELTRGLQPGKPILSGKQPKSKMHAISLISHTPGLSLAPLHCVRDTRKVSLHVGKVISHEACSIVRCRACPVLKVGHGNAVRVQDGLQLVGLPRPCFAERVLPQISSPRQEPDSEFQVQFPASAHSDLSHTVTKSINC